MVFVVTETFIIAVFVSLISEKGRKLLKNNEFYSIFFLTEI